MIQALKCNYHTHTRRCMHAEGGDEEYFQAAIRGGFGVLGFSDHAPFPFASGYVSPIRMTMEELPGYLASCQSLKARYAGQIRLHVGLEAEYFPRYDDHLRRLRDLGVEYLILGQHYADSEEYSPYVGSACARDDEVLRYAEAVVRGIRSGLFAYVAHPDLMMRVRSEEQFSRACMDAADMICQAAMEAGLPLEHNLLGLALQISGTGCGYPSSAFWNHIAPRRPRVILGVDAHKPSLLESGYLWLRGVDTVKALGLERVSCLSLD